MPCDAVSILQVTLATNALPELLASENARAALKAYIETLTQDRPVIITVNGEQIRISTSGYDQLELRMSMTELTGRVYGWSQYQSEALVKKIQEAADSIALVSIQIRTIDLLKRRYLVQSDVELDGGARMITLNV